jgi:hypothetical protein
MLNSRLRDALALFVVSLAAGGIAHAQDKKYAVMAPVEQYLMADRGAEITLARSAAPPSISAGAEVLVLDSRGYQPAVKGGNGFVCFVERSWTAALGDPEFWNPKLRAPNCFNAPAARSVLPQYLERTQWVLAGATRQQVIEKTRAAFADHRFQAPEPGALTFMLSKDGYVSDAAAGPWMPHMMFFVAHGQAGFWGAGLDGSPVLGVDSSADEPTVLLVPVRQWSDGTPSPSPAEPHTHAK